MKACEILELQDDKLLLAGIIYLNGDQVTSKTALGFDDTMKYVLGSPVIASDGSRISVKDNPQDWFARLPKEYHGTLLKARMLGSKDEPSEAGVDQFKERAT